MTEIPRNLTAAEELLEKAVREGRLSTPEAMTLALPINGVQRLRALYESPSDFDDKRLSPALRAAFIRTQKAVDEFGTWLATGTQKA